MANALPNDSYWLGVTHLTSGWDPKGADPGFDDLVRTMHRRTAAKELTVLRLYCAPDQDSLSAMKTHLDREVKAGVIVRVLTGSERPPDMSLLWSPSQDPVQLRQAVEPAATLAAKGAKPLCGMEFTTRGGHSLDVLSLHSPGSSQFRYLDKKFDRFWQQGIPHTP